MPFIPDLVDKMKLPKRSFTPNDEMNSWSRRTSWSYRGYRGLRMKVQHIPQQICKACTRSLARACECETIRYCFIIVTLCTLCCFLFGWVLYRDPCFEWQIRTSLCNDYQNGLLAGSLCYDLCIEEAIQLSSCIEQTGQIYVFKWKDAVIKARLPEKSGSEAEASAVFVWEGMTRANFVDVLEEFFTRNLGNNDHSSVIDRAIEYADFNKDNQLTYGEISSLWLLLQIPEFQTLFIFQHNSVFPSINGTCGSLYAYEAAYHQILYDRNGTSYIDSVFPNRYRWHLPAFPKRVHIALGLLEYVYATMETENTRFYMCDFSPTNFGYTQYFEMKVSNVQGIISEPLLNKTLQRITCKRDSDCRHGDVCRSKCNKTTQRCLGIDVNYIPDIVKICYILQDYIVYGMPVKLKYTLSHVVADCIRMSKKLRSKTPSTILVDQNLAHDRLNQILWNELKYAETKWLTRPTQKPPLLI